LKFKPPEIWTTSHSNTDKERKLLNAFLKEGFNVEEVECDFYSLCGYECKLKGSVYYKRRDNTGFTIQFWVWIPTKNPVGDFELDFDVLSTDAHEDERTIVDDFLFVKARKAIGRAYSP